MPNNDEMSLEELRFATPSEIAEELGRRAKLLRVNTLRMSQKAFAEKIGMAYGTYQQFEQKGKIRLEDFILVVTHLGRVGELGELLKAPGVTSLGLAALSAGKSIPKKRVGKK